MESLTIETLAKLDGSTCYACSNEHIPTWKELLGNVRVDRAAGICSGGEVSFFVVLPHVKKELVLVDHALGSMYFAIGKYKLIDKHGPEKAMELAKQQVPHSVLANEFAEANKDLPTCKKALSKPTPHLARAWTDLGVEDLAEFNKNKDKLSFIHADISVLNDRGQFELLYLSNALDYIYGLYRDYKASPSEFDSDKIVAPGGLIAFCYFSHCRPYYADKWETIATKAAPRDRKHGLAWIHEIARRPQ